MDSPVFVWPLHLLGGIFADLHAGSPLSSGFDLMDSNLDVHGVSGHQITLVFDFATHLVPSGRLNLAATGIRSAGAAECERSAVMEMVQAIRSRFHLFPADYNYVAISACRPLYNSLKVNLDGFSRAYMDMDTSLLAVHTGVTILCSNISEWLAIRDPMTPKAETVSVNALHARLTDQARTVEQDLAHASELVNIILSRDAVPVEQRRFDETVPNPTPVSWERSYFALRTIYDEAIVKFNCTVSPVRLVQNEERQFRGTIDLSGPPNVMWGPADSSSLAAKAKFLYTVIKYVDESIGCRIFDLHYVVRQHQSNFIRRFDHKIDGIWRCAERLKRLMESTVDVFDKSTDDLSPNLSGSASSQDVANYIEACSAQLRRSKVTFEAAFERLSSLKVTRASVQAGLGGVP